MEFQIGDLVMFEEDKYELEIYGYVTGFDDEIELVSVSWFDGQKSQEFPNHLIKVENG
jgi:hypothetical protein